MEHNSNGIQRNNRDQHDVEHQAYAPALTSRGFHNPIECAAGVGQADSHGYWDR